MIRQPRPVRTPPFSKTSTHLPSCVVLTGKVNLVDLAGSENNKVPCATVLFLKMNLQLFEHSSLVTILCAWLNPLQSTSL
jgi:hypothetical protein